MDQPSKIGDHNWSRGKIITLKQLKNGEIEFINSNDRNLINTIEENHPLANTMRFSLLIDWL